MADEIKLARCACGRKARLEIGIQSCYVVCSGAVGCWIGPPRETQRAAALAWNRVMGKEAKRGNKP